MKNELNAAQHFIIYLQTTFSLAVRNPDLNGLLTSVAGVLTMYQHGARKMIARDRGNKTNLQYRNKTICDVADVTRQYQDQKLVEKANKQLSHKHYYYIAYN